MPKFKPYESPFEYLSKKIRPLKYLADFYYKINKFDDPSITFGKDPRDPLRPYFLGGFNPVLSIGKDSVDTFKPYKSNFYFFRDLIQPFRGLGNIVKSIFNLVISPLLFVANTLKYLCLGIAQRSFFLFSENMKMNIAKSSGGFLEGITSLLRGLGQVVTTPATWFLRIPLRAIITRVKGMPTLVESQKNNAEKTIAMVNKEGKNIEDTIAIDRKIPSFYTKTLKALIRGQKLGADYQEVEEKFHACTQFTEKHLNDKGAQAIKSYGVALKDSYDYNVIDNKESRRLAISFLSIFSNKVVLTNTEQNKPHESDALFTSELSCN